MSVDLNAEAMQLQQEHYELAKERDHYRRGVLACDENNKRLREENKLLRGELTELLREGRNVQEYLEHGIDPSDASDVRLARLGEALDCAGHVLAGGADS